MSGTGITGGTSGTGVNTESIETTIEGNVSQVQESIDGIRVSVENGAAEAWTDGEGQFWFAGRFGEHETVLFERDASRARLPIVVPDGGTLTLDQIVIDFEDGSARVEASEVRFEGIVQSKDCRRLELRVTSRFAPDGSEYVVHIDGASVATPGGRPRTCQGIAPGDVVLIEGPIDDDGTVGGEGSRTGQTVTGIAMP